MLAGLSPASTPDLSAIVAKELWPIYGFMLAGLSSASISDLAPTVAQDWPPMYRYVFTSQCIDLCRLACLLPVPLILVSPTMAQDRPANVPIYVDRSVFRQYF